MQKKRNTVPVKVKQTSPTTCPVCGSKTERLGGDFWQCESLSCGEKSASLLKVEKQLAPAIAEFRKSFEAGIEIINQNLREAGLRNKFGDFKKLESVARIYLGLSPKEFGKLTPREFSDMLEVQNDLEKRPKPKPPTQVPTEKFQSLPEWSSPLKKAIRSGLNTIGNRGDNKELRRWLTLNAPDEVKRQLLSKDKSAQHVVTVAISEVRTAMRIPASN